jgi:hypothetical protein
LKGKEERKGKFEGKTNTKEECEKTLREKSCEGRTLKKGEI